MFQRGLKLHLISETVTIKEANELDLDISIYSVRVHYLFSESSVWVFYVHVFEKANIIGK